RQDEVVDRVANPTRLPDRGRLRPFRRLVGPMTPLVGSEGLGRCDRRRRWWVTGRGDHAAEDGNREADRENPTDNPTHGRQSPGLRSILPWTAGVRASNN